jgi:predicted ATPase/class 3 adenylate cyclase
METPSAYIPIDRCQAMARGESLPDRASGAALFADISGFTPLTEALLKEYGPKRGAEELTRQLNLIYDALVTEVHRYGGSVMAFSGDAITCWFDDKVSTRVGTALETGLQATACGLSMQQTMDQFADIESPSGARTSLAMKVAVATGSVRRFQVGDPRVQYIDTLAGAMLDEMAATEHQAKRGEVVVGPAALAQIGDKIEISEWRRDPETGQQFGVVARLSDRYQAQVAATLQPIRSPETLSEDQIRPWLLPPVYERLSAGKGEFLAELRPAVALFLSFTGIDYDEDEAAETKLETYVRWVQNILIRYDAYLLQLTIGDKGSYLYAAFGAPVAHEDDAVRAVSVALELQKPPADLGFIENIKIGISQGQMRTGAYGGTMRRTYGVLGDEVNLAARLMQAAEPGQILVKDTVWQATDNYFSGESLPPFEVKGKSKPVITYSVSGIKVQQAIRLQEPSYALPMVGRETELALVEQKMTQALAGHGQIVAIVAEAGMGKSRLVAEVIRLATERRLVGYGGECQSYGTNTSYLVWQPICRSFFNLDPAWELKDQMRELESQLELVDPSLVQRLPLLGAVLNLSIPDNDLTRSFDVKLRKTSLESLLVDCLRAHAKITPLLLVLDDCHWLDPLSLELLEVIGRTIFNLPVLMVMAYRPLQSERLRDAQVGKLAYFSEIQLTDFTPQEAERLISLKLEQFFGAQAEVPPVLLERITARSQGNPFYIEELLNYLQDQNFDPNETDTLNQLDLPTSLHSLILSRIDQLSEHQKSTIKVASVIGRLFEAAWLWGMYPDLGKPERIRADLEALHRLEFAPMDKPEPELTYIFKHVVTQEVAYESLPYAMRAILHDQFGQFIERKYSERLDRYVDLLAFHYDRSENEVKKREYLRKAGEAAQENYANEAAIDYYQRLLPLLPAAKQVEVMLKLGEVLQRVGQWDEAGQLYHEALDLAKQLDDQSSLGWCQTAMGEVLRKQGLYAEAATWFEQAQTTFDELGDNAGVGQVLHYSGTLAAQQGDYETARTLYEASMVIRQQLNDQPRIASLLSNLGLVAHYQGNYEEARSLYVRSLEIRYHLADQWAIAVSLNNLGYLALEQGDYETARTQLEVAINLQREVGDKSMMADALNNLGNVTRDQGDYQAARALYEEGLTINRDLGNKWGIAYLLEDIGGLAALQNQPERALRLIGAAEVLRESIGAALPPTEQAALARLLEPARQTLDEAATTSVMAEGRAMSLEQAIEYAFEKI